MKKKELRRQLQTCRASRNNLARAALAVTDLEPPYVGGELLAAIANLRREIGPVIRLTEVVESWVVPVLPERLPETRLR